MFMESIVQQSKKNLKYWSNVYGRAKNGKAKAVPMNAENNISKIKWLGTFGTLCNLSFYILFCFIMFLYCSVLFLSLLKWLLEAGKDEWNFNLVVQQGRLISYIHSSVFIQGFFCKMFSTFFSSIFKPCFGGKHLLEGHLRVFDYFIFFRESLGLKKKKKHGKKLWINFRQMCAIQENMRYSSIKVKNMSLGGQWAEVSEISLRSRGCHLRNSQVTQVCMNQVFTKVFFF